MNAQLSNISITFVSLNRDIVQEVNNVFTGYDNINVIRCNIAQCDAHDCVVSPANSFGNMDGGIDRTLSYMLNTIDNPDYIGMKVRKVIRERYYGEQPVGTCIIVPTVSNKWRYLAHAPTMRVPRDCNGTLNPYYAFKAVLGEVLNFNKDNPQNPIRSILTTTFCTGCGRVPVSHALKQMKKAYDVVYKGVNNRWFSGHDLDEELEDLKKNE